ncbi:hypothetical protein AK812_SmicGene23896 [Symbiodinium microadriaticum]|uniref:Uncharacterized protein n=1 Tax=Symbiodinium microadriaticum TaxID=2951 RepID=A0A1Q9DG75_SYMMI|nr:hypothetical protein AK812_SmicGene23896 [Symbiodinium microadriaticum]
MKGYGKDPSVNGILASFWGLAADRQWSPDFHRVPSEANVSDAVSRGDDSRARAEGWTRVATPVDDIMDVLGRAASVPTPCGVWVRRAGAEVRTPAPAPILGRFITITTTSATATTTATLIILILILLLLLLIIIIIIIVITVITIIIVIIRINAKPVDPRTFGTSPMVEAFGLVMFLADDSRSRSFTCLVLVSLEGLLPDAASPDWDAPVKLRMLCRRPGDAEVLLVASEAFDADDCHHGHDNATCASSRRTLREEFADFSFREYNATERSEVTLAQYVESTRDRTEDDRHAAMTRDEIDQEEVRKQVAKEQASAPKLLAGLAALQVRTQPSFEDSMKRFLEKTEGSAVITKLAGALVRDGNVGLKPSNVYTAIQDSEELGAELIEAVLRGHGWRRQEVINRLRGGPGKYRVQPARSGREAEDEDLYLQGRSFFGFRSASLLPQRISVMEKYGIFAQASVVENVRSFAGDMEEAGDDDDLEDDLGAPRAIVSEEASPVPKATGPRPPAGGIALPGFGPPSPLKPTSPSRGEGGGYAQTSPLCLNSDSLRFKEKEKMDEKSVFDAKPQVQSMVVQSLHKHNITERAQRLQYRRFPLHGLQELQDSSFWKEKNVVATERERYLRDDVFQTL